MATRVQIPAYTDRWMMGDRYGVIVKTSDAKGVRIAYVLLDKSGKTVKVIDADCVEI